MKAGVLRDHKGTESLVTHARDGWASSAISIIVGRIVFCFHRVISQPSLRSLSTYFFSNSPHHSQNHFAIFFFEVFAFRAIIGHNYVNVLCLCMTVIELAAACWLDVSFCLLPMWIAERYQNCGSGEINLLQVIFQQKQRETQHFAVLCLS